MRPGSKFTVAPLCGPGEDQMVKNFEDLQQVSKDNVDVTLKAMGALSKGTQAIAVEVAD